jgi:hypothetical protein
VRAAGSKAAPKAKARKTTSSSKATGVTKGKVSG